MTWMSVTLIIRFHLMRINAEKKKTPFSYHNRRKMFFQCLIIGLAIMGLWVMINEIMKIYGGGKVEGRIYILCVPQTKNLEGFCSEVLNRFRRNGFGEDIIVCSEEMTDEDKKIMREREKHIVRKIIV